MRATLTAVFSTERTIGSYARSPFKFDLLNLQTAKITVEGEDIPSVPYVLDISTKKLVPQFIDLIKACGFYNTNNSNGVTFGDYVQGYCVLVCRCYYY